MSFYGEEETIAHYGVKGMRWGVRKDRTTASSKHRSDTVRKLAVNAAAGALIVAGAAVARSMIESSGHLKVSQLDIPDTGFNSGLRPFSDMSPKPKKSPDFVDLMR